MSANRELCVWLQKLNNLIENQKKITKHFSEKSKQTIFVTKPLRETRSNKKQQRGVWGIN
jgi:hypothetical protein